jgi:hypothetical protein
VFGTDLVPMAADVKDWDGVRLSFLVLSSHCIELYFSANSSDRSLDLINEFIDQSGPLGICRK